MIQPRWLQALYRLGLELWLPLPLLGLGFWVAGGLVTDQVLSRAYRTAAQLQANRPPKVQRSVTVLPSALVLSIEVVVKADQGLSQVKVTPTNSVLKVLIFEFPTTEVGQVEAAIAQELRLPPEVVRKVVRYQVED